MAYTNNLNSNESVEQFDFSFTDVLAFEFIDSGRTSTPFPSPKNSPTTVVKNPNFKRVAFASPQIIDISFDNEHFKKSVYGEKLGITPKRSTMKVRPRSLTYSDAKKSVMKPSKIPNLKRLSCQTKTIEVSIEEKSIKIKGVKLNKRFELQMKKMKSKKNF
ncbi:hypothetical protein PVAND_014648 [Polypedilum vanderplanki]|uniref:Uncharacterized protein n=1 Tax=Polypedilum vanderplanki TaxID=319348 RepID=A0A9J6BAM2_POLVA|nr:hypothetical protein PVAND_014648 [Polypedilum vanderplanki]